MRNEVVVVPTYLRPELLYCCLRRILKCEPDLPVVVFPDRGSFYDVKTRQVVENFSSKHHIHAHLVPDHEYYGNSYNVMESLRWAFNEGYRKVFYVEDDVMVHEDFFDWHRETHEEYPEIFASMAWVFNRYAPLEEQTLFQPWYYAIGTCFLRERLGLLVPHASPRYYEDMSKYVGEQFPDSPLSQNRRQFGIEHYEQDGLIQRVIDHARMTTASPGIAKCTHLGTYGYNRGWGTQLDLFANCQTFKDRVDRLELLMADPYERAEYFGKEVVEREIGYKLVPREFRYRLKLGDWETEFKSERNITPKNMPRVVNSVRLNPEGIIEKIS